MKAKNAVYGIISTLLLIPVSSNAESLKKYIQLNAGYAQGLAPKGDFEKGTMKKSGIYGAEFGYKINDHLRASLSVDYRDRFSNKYWTTTQYKKAYVTSSIKVKALAVLANINYDITTIGRFTPYLVAGVGVSRVTSGPRVAKFDMGPHTVTSSIVKSTMTNFAYKVGTGTTIAINERVSLDLRYQFVNLGRFRTGSERDICVNGKFRKIILADKIRGRLRSHEFIFGMSYKF